VMHFLSEGMMHCSSIYLLRLQITLQPTISAYKHTQTGDFGSAQVLYLHKTMHKDKFSVKE